jgi:hypothetical protein
MTAAETRSPRSPWIKRAAIGATAALMIGGGIGVTANAAPGDAVVTNVFGNTEQAALENGKKVCEQRFMDFGGQAGPVKQLGGDPNEVGPNGPVDTVQMPIRCIERPDTPRPPAG